MSDDTGWDDLDLDLDQSEKDPDTPSQEELKEKGPKQLRMEYGPFFYLGVDVEHESSDEE